MTFIVFVIGTVLESYSIICGILFYFVFRHGAYAVSILYIIANMHTKGWFVLSISISVIFLIMVDSWRSITITYDESNSLYDKHMMCFICVATILSWASADRLSAIVKSEKINKSDDASA